MSAQREYGMRWERKRSGWPFAISRYLRKEIERIARRGFTPEEQHKWNAMKKAEAKPEAAAS